MDLNQELVRMGLALAYRRYSLDYVEAEENAQFNGTGAWLSEFVPPWQWGGEH
jgi:endonuclease YncB( thermonuclease family)